MLSEKRMVRLEAQLSPVNGEDTAAQAGRKVLLGNFIKMMAQEEGSRQGDDIEHVHDMRVAIRRMRSVINIFGNYYKPKAFDAYVKGLRKTARRLGTVRDLDVMIDDLSRYKSEQDEANQAAVQGLIDALDEKRTEARKKLIIWFDSKDYSAFLKAFSQFLKNEGKGEVEPDSVLEPHQVRHVAPLVIHEALAAVRAYDVIVADADFEALHTLRIGFKRLRYTIDSFKDVLGSTASAYVDEIKTMQDYLGRLNDLVVAQNRLGSLGKLPKDQAAVRDAYLAEIEQEANERVTNFVTEAWEPFNKRAVQSKLSNAILALR